MPMVPKVCRNTKQADWWHCRWLLLPQLKKYTSAAVSVEDLDEVLRPVRLLLADHLVIPVDSNGVLFEDAMDKFETE